jgi:hypothetical protein
MPILDGAPGFVLLAFVMALAAYLRQVSTTAQKQIDDIESGSPAAYPYQQASRSVREERIGFLLAMRGKLAIVTHFFFLFLVLLAARMVFYASTKFAWFEAKFADFARYWFDLSYVSGLLVLIIAMWIMHTIARGRDARLRANAVASLATTQQHLDGHQST